MEPPQLNSGGVWGGAEPPQLNSGGVLGRGGVSYIAVTSTVLLLLRLLIVLVCRILLVNRFSAVMSRRLHAAVMCSRRRWLVVLLISVGVRRGGRRLRRWL